MLRMVRAAAQRVAAEMGFPLDDAFILGTQEPDSRPYNPTMLDKGFAAFCRINGFDCTFHDLRHTFATMMIVNGLDVRTVASYLGHASISMALDIYADMDPDAKRAAVGKVDKSFDLDMGSPALWKLQVCLIASYLRVGGGIESPYQAMTFGGRRVHPGREGRGCQTLCK
ncbi:tyrosine-type recombinase/integrase, partial [bacterium]|nr:tyrosine-type recombinase/integrase [bacterium]